MTRETKEIKTPGGYVIVLWNYLTGADQREMDKVFLSYALNDETPATLPVTTKIEIQQKQQDKVIQLMVVSIDGEKDKEKILKAVLDWPIIDFNFLLKEINSLTLGGETKKKD